jgi:hypothetical protein
MSTKRRETRLLLAAGGLGVLVALGVAAGLPTFGFWLTFGAALVAAVYREVAPAARVSRVQRPARRVSRAPVAARPGLR